MDFFFSMDFWLFALRWLTGLTLAAGIGSSAIATFLLWESSRRLLLATPRNRGIGLPNWLLGALVAAFGLTTGHYFLRYWGAEHWFDLLDVTPLDCAFWLGPLLFFSIKSRLYPNFRLHRSDAKHFILPVAQTSLLLLLWTKNAAAKQAFKFYAFTPFYGNFEKAVFILSFGLYLYFAYRFVLHQRLVLQKQVRGSSTRRQIFITGWLKRLVKVLFVLFAIHSFLMLSDYFADKWLHVSLLSRALFAAVWALSFAAMLFWLLLNAAFAWRRYV
jgi:hypothetical protein